MKIDNNLASYCIVHTDLTLGQSNDRDSYKYYVLLRMGGGPLPGGGGGYLGFRSLKISLSVRLIVRV